MIAESARFNGTVFMTVTQYNAIAPANRRTIGQQRYAVHNGQWRKVGFVKPKEVAVAVPVKAAA